MFLVRLRRPLHLVRAIPPGALWLVLTAAPVVAQAALGHGPIGRTDYVVYLPLVWATVAVVAVARAELSERWLFRALVTGALVTAMLMVVSLFRGELHDYAIPGQDPRVVHLRATELARQLGITPDAIGGEEVVPLSAGMLKYYQWKLLARSPLGSSNYLAIFFLFLLNVTLYSRRRGRIVLAVLFTALIAITLSRIGMVFTAASFAVHAADRRGRLRPLLIGGGIVVTAGAATAAMMVGAGIAGRLGTSLAIRLQKQVEAVEVIVRHPWFGIPRSEIVRIFGHPITWHPHNGLLQVLVLFGVIGAACYVIYLVLVLRTIQRRATDSDLWRGIFAGLCIVLCWSTIEIVLLTPHFQLLVAVLYGLAREPEESRP